jgi:hypothetical protein
MAYGHHDVDAVELNVSASNGSFGASICLWVVQGQLGKAADLLAGFPEHLKDTRELTLGGPEFAGGLMNLKFSCIDLEGHCRLHIRMNPDDEHRESLAEGVELIAAVEPPALDSFVEQMRTLNAWLSGSAVLRFL